MYTRARITRVTHFQDTQVKKGVSQLCFVERLPAQLLMHFWEREKKKRIKLPLASPWQRAQPQCPSHLPCWGKLSQFSALGSSWSSAAPEGEGSLGQRTSHAWLGRGCFSQGASLSTQARQAAQPWRWWPSATMSPDHKAILWWWGRAAVKKVSQPTGWALTQEVDQHSQGTAEEGTSSPRLSLRKAQGSVGVEGPRWGWSGPLRLISALRASTQGFTG